MKSRLGFMEFKQSVDEVVGAAILIIMGDFINYPMVEKWSHPIIIHADLFPTYH